MNKFIFIIAIFAMFALTACGSRSATSETSDQTSEGAEVTGSDVVEGDTLQSATEEVEDKPEDQVVM